MSYHLPSSRIRTARCRRRPAPSTRLCRPLKHACQHDRWKTQKCRWETTWLNSLSSLFCFGKCQAGIVRHQWRGRGFRRCTLPMDADHEAAAMALYMLSDSSKVVDFVMRTCRAARCPHCSRVRPPDNDDAWTCGVCMGEGFLWP